MRYYMVGDIHGNLPLLGSYQKYLKEEETKYGKENMRLIFLGDYIDRGRGGVQAIHKVQSLLSTYGGEMLRGNHEKMLYDFITLGNNLFLYNDYRLYTLRSMLSGGKYDGRTLLNMRGSIYTEKGEDITTAIREELIRRDKGFLDAYMSMTLSYEHEDFIVVHAGLTGNLLTTSNQDKLWLYPPSNHTNTTGKTVIVGHTMTVEFGVDGAIYYAREQDTYYIDSKLGYLNLLIYDTTSKEYTLHDKKFGIKT